LLSANPAPENKSKIRGILSLAQKRPSDNQPCHAFHHALTMKTPPIAAYFCQKPLQINTNGPGPASEPDTEKKAAQTSPES
jgi:hypothetical protein